MTSKTVPRRLDNKKSWVTSKLREQKIEMN